MKWFHSVIITSAPAIGLLAGLHKNYRMGFNKTWWEDLEWDKEQGFKIWCRSGNFHLRGRLGLGGVLWCTEYKLHKCVGFCLKIGVSNSFSNQFGLPGTWIMLDKLYGPISLHFKTSLFSAVAPEIFVD